MNKEFAHTALIITRATFDNIAQIQDIVRKTWPIAYTSILGQEQVSYMLDKFYNTASLSDQIKKGHIFFIAAKDHEAIGFASFSKIDQNIFRLQKLYVLPHKQQTGAGKALLQKIEKEAKSIGAEKLRLNVNRKNSAKSFYEKNGFAVIEQADIDIGNGYFMNDYIMEKQL